MTETLDFGALRRRGAALSFALVVRAPGGGRHPIDGTILVGKHADNDVVIDATGVSRYHLEVRAEDDAVVVKDVGSKNGTYYDGARITEARLGAGAILRIGGPAGTELGIELAHAPAIEPSTADCFGPLIGRAPGMRSIFTVLERTAPSTATILILGETGTGKEICAQAIHAASPRKQAPFVVIDCGAIPHHLIEAELFGHKKGAFTDASSERIGAFEAAQGGTLFLDEIGEAPIEVQVMLLRTLETGVVRPVGGRDEVKVDVRLVTATDADLARAADEGRFRPALLHRLAGYEIHLPPLRARKDDLGILLLGFLREELARLGVPDKLGSGDPKNPWLPAAVVGRLARYDWPGNVRQLRNVARHIAISGRDADVVPLDQGLERLLTMVTAPTPSGPGAATPAAALTEKESRRRPSDVTEEELMTALKKNRFRLEPTAVDLRITRPSLYMLIDKSTRLRKAKDIPRDELLRLNDELNGDVDAMAEKLEVSSRGLYLRLRELQRTAE